ncbi:MAG TPA: YhbY family RNA-binding protein [Polyangia bacterium]|jgi:RNA-binding protein|nr:YhbY family RNA-binding protein [Polyangia bacterium]
MVSPSTVSLKKKSLMPSSALRSKLRGAGHALSAIVQIGKDGTTAAVLKQLGQALRDHELVKVKIGSECPESRFEVAEQIAIQSGADLAQILGRTVLVYKRDPEKSRFELRAVPRAEASREKSKHPKGKSV